MDEAGIDKTVLFACICPILYSSNEFVAENCQKYPDKFIGFASVDPNDSHALMDLENAIKNLHLKGLKFHPPMQHFMPNDKQVWPIYDLANQLHIPVVFHVGSTPFGSLALLKQANPILIDEVAVAFPQLPIILTHLGTLWHNESFMVAEKNAHVYIDTAAYPHEIGELMTEKLIKRVGENKFIFGTDFPMPYEDKLHEMKDFVECIQKLKISDKVKEMIFCKNLESILSL
jgi:predicted TIM-barrel fold metal-dependent hydrolase